MTITFLPWTPSRSPDELSGCTTNIVLENARVWGTFRQINGSIVCLGSAGFGLTPVAAIAPKALLIGVDDMLVGVQPHNGLEIFRYRTPSVFHQFITVGKESVLYRDEIGFGCVDYEGNETWLECFDGPIKEFAIVENNIVGSTIEGTRFSVRFPYLE